MAIFKNIGKGASSLGRKAVQGYLNYSNALLPQTALLPRAAVAGLNDIVAGAYGVEDQPSRGSQFKGALDPREYAAAQLLNQPVARQPVVAAPVQAPRVIAPNVAPYQGVASILDAAVNNSPQPVNPQQGIVDLLTGAANSPEAQPRPDTEVRPYAYQQPAVRNAFTMNAPADDARARIKAEEARIRFNSAEQSFKSLKTPEAEAAFKEAQADADRWGKWAAMAPNARKQVLMNGERAANAAQGRDKFATLRNEMDTPGAAELLAYAAAVNSGGPAVTRQPDGSATVSGRYGSGYTTGATAPRGTRTALSDTTDYLRNRQKVRSAFENGQAASLLL